jgi:hypothetical protein
LVAAEPSNARPCAITAPVPSGVWLELRMA